MQLTDYTKIAEKYIKENDVNFIVNAIGREFMMKYGKEEAMRVLTPFMKDRSFVNSVEGLIYYFSVMKLDYIALDNIVGTIIGIK